MQLAETIVMHAYTMPSLVQEKKGAHQTTPPLISQSLPIRKSPTNKNLERRQKPFGSVQHVDCNRLAIGHLPFGGGRKMPYVGVVDVLTHKEIPLPNRCDLVIHTS